MTGRPRTGAARSLAVALGCAMIAAAAPVPMAVSGAPVETATIRAAATSLFGDYYAAGALPEDATDRRAYATSEAGKANRAAMIAEVWVPERAGAEVANLESGVASFQCDGDDPCDWTYVSSRFVPVSWGPVDQMGDLAQVEVTGHVEFTDTRGLVSTDNLTTWVVSVVRGHGPAKYSGWQLSGRRAIAYPEGQG